jgi:hypothetical protein
MNQALDFIRGNWSAITALATALVAAVAPAQASGLTALLNVLAVLFAGHAAAQTGANKATDRVLATMVVPMMEAAARQPEGPGPGPKVSRFK